MEMVQMEFKNGNTDCDPFSPSWKLERAANRRTAKANAQHKSNTTPLVLVCVIVTFRVSMDGAEEGHESQQ